MRLPGPSTTYHDGGELGWAITIPASTATVPVWLRYWCTANTDAYWGVTEWDTHVSTAYAGTLSQQYPTDAGSIVVSNCTNGDTCATDEL